MGDGALMIQGGDGLEESREGEATGREVGPGHQPRIIGTWETGLRRRAWQE